MKMKISALTAFLRNYGHRLKFIGELLLLLVLLIFIVNLNFEVNWANLWSHEHSNVAGWKHYPYNPPGTEITFPRDEGLHPSNTTEWQIFYINLTGDNACNYSLITSYDRYGTFTNMFITLLNYTSGERYTAEMTGVVYGEEYFLNFMFKPFKYTQTCTHRLYQIPDKPFTYFFSHTSITDDGKKIQFSFTMDSRKPPMIIGGNGIVEMGGGGYSYYYSLTHLSTEGVLQIDKEIVNVRGVGWFDHQWGNYKPKDGWEWFCAKLNGDIEIMASHFINSTTGRTYNPFLYIYFPEHYIPTSNISIIPLAYWRPAADSPEVYAMGWTLISEEYGLNITIEPVIRSQMVLEGIWWEGGCSVHGQIGGRVVQGHGAAELFRTRTSEISPTPLSHYKTPHG